MTASFMDSKSVLLQRPPTFVAPETSFVEDNLSTDQGLGGGFQFNAHNIYCVLYYYYIQPPLKSSHIRS